MVKRIVERETPSWCSLMMIISDSPLMPLMAMGSYLEAQPSAVFMKRSDARRCRHRTQRP